MHQLSLLEPPKPWTKIKSAIGSLSSPGECKSDKPRGSDARLGARCTGRTTRPVVGGLGSPEATSVASLSKLTERLAFELGDASPALLGAPPARRYLDEKSLR